MESPREETNAQGSEKRIGCERDPSFEPHGQPRQDPPRATHSAASKKPPVKRSVSHRQIAVISPHERDEARGPRPKRSVFGAMQSLFKRKQSTSSDNLSSMPRRSESNPTPVTDRADPVTWVRAKSEEMAGLKQHKTRAEYHMKQSPLTHEQTKRAIRHLRRPAQSSHVAPTPKAHGA